MKNTLKKLIAVCASLAIIASLGTATAFAAPVNKTTASTDVSVTPFAVYPPISVYITAPSSTPSPAFATYNPGSTNHTVKIKATSLPGSSWNLGIHDNSTGGDDWHTLSLNQYGQFTAIAGHTYDFRASTYSASGYATVVIED
jgi:hypothetical protein